MLSACAASSAEAPRVLSDPVIEQRRVVIARCPAELLAEVPPAPVPEPQAVVDGNAAGMTWLGAFTDWGLLLAARLHDAKGQC